MSSLPRSILLLATVAAAAVSYSDVQSTSLPVLSEPVVSTKLSYNGPGVPVGDFTGSTFRQITQQPAVTPSGSNPTNNINSVALAYVPTGINVHFATPFPLTGVATVKYGATPSALNSTATGTTQTYARVPACTQATVTNCTQYFHNVQITGLKSGATYYYSIAGDNSGTAASPVQAFTTALAAGDATPYNVTILADMGYQNAVPSQALMVNLVPTSRAFLHAGDSSYADNWSYGLIALGDAEQQGLNYSAAAASAAAHYPRGGDIADQYETNWDLWQMWMSNITMRKPYMVAPGNHEASCIESDDAPYIVTNYLNNNATNQTDANGSTTDTLNYYSCPASQRNFTAYSNRFRMPTRESNAGDQPNMWFSWDEGLVHYVSLNTETDYPQSQELPFTAMATKYNVSVDALAKQQTKVLNAGPFGVAGNQTSTVGWQQIAWLEADLAKVNRSVTPWIVVFSHRPFYSAAAVPAPGGAPTSYFYQARTAFESILIKHGVDAYFCGHIHWYERMLPMANGVIDTSAIKNNNTYISTGKSFTHIITGQAGNIESHVTCGGSTACNLNSTAYLDQTNFGLGTLTVVNSTALYWQQYRASDMTAGDYLWIVKPNN